MSDLCAIEELPFPYVYYPAFNGVFIGFKNQNNSKIKFCSCHRLSFENYFKLKKIEERDFPSEYFQFLKEINTTQKDFYSLIEFEDNVCHLCNKAYPNCEGINRGDFYIQFLNYIHVYFFKYGISDLHGPILKEYCPDGLLKLIEIDSIEAIKNFKTLNPNNKPLDQLDQKTINDINSIMNPVFEQDKRIRNYVENQIRRIYGLKDIGDYWVNETKLYNIIADLFPDFKIKRHHRPVFLNGLEIDIYIEKLKLGIEYQGKQHFEPVKHFGGNKKYNELLIRDLKKSEICKSIGIELIYFNYYDDLSVEKIINKLKSCDLRSRSLKNGKIFRC